MENMNSMKVEAYTSQCIGLIITGFHYYGKITKTNKKSIKVKLNHFTKTYDNKVATDIDISDECTFTYWKTIIPEYGPNEGKETKLYKNQTKGIIEIAC